MELRVYMQHIDILNDQVRVDHRVTEDQAAEVFLEVFLLHRLEDQLDREVVVLHQMTDSGEVTLEEALEAAADTLTADTLVVVSMEEDQMVAVDIKSLLDIPLDIVRF